MTKKVYPGHSLFASLVLLVLSPSKSKIGLLQPKRFSSLARLASAPSNLRPKRSIPATLFLRALSCSFYLLLNSYYSILNCRKAIRLGEIPNITYRKVNITAERQYRFADRQTSSLARLASAPSNLRPKRSTPAALLMRALSCLLLCPQLP